MKKQINYLAIFVILFAIVSACGETNRKTSEEKDKTEKINYGEYKVEVYYFHGDRRCASCNNIEKVSENTVKTIFGNNEDVKFYVINFDKRENKEMADKYDVSFAALIIASGEKFIDLTIEAFQYASVNPQRLEEEIAEVINDFL